MKVKIDEVGNLIITPENSIEHFALQHWIENNGEAISSNCNFCIEHI